MPKQLLAKVIDLFQTKRSLVPDDGSYGPVNPDGSREYKPAHRRINDSKLDLPALNPITFDHLTPRLFHPAKRLTWHRYEDANDVPVGTLLRGASDHIYMVVKGHTYLHPFDGGRRFLMYKHEPEIEGNRQFLTIKIINTADLKPLAFDEVISYMQRGQGSVLCDAPVKVERIELIPNRYEFAHPFSDELKSIEEFFVAHEIEWLPGQQGARTALLMMRPREGVVEIIPQDWFNNDESIDFMYQWIAMAGRDPSTRKIHGYGIRLTNFVLDPTGRHLERGGKVSFF